MKEIGREKSTYYIYKYIGLYKRKQLKVHGYNICRRWQYVNARKNRVNN